MDAVDLESEYTPSRWSLRFDTPNEVLQHHEKIVTEASELATNSIPHKLEIEYGSTPGQKLDILGTDLPDDAPILVYIHGGFWQMLSREISRYPALALYRSKVKTVVVGYDLCPAVTLAEIVNQIQNAARFVFEYAEKMGSRGVYFAGHCAGAYLVAKLIANAGLLDSLVGSKRLQGVFLVSGLYDIREIIQTTANDILQLPREWAVLLSPQFDDFTHLLLRKVRVYILAAENDSPTYKKQSREFYDHLNKVCLMQNMFLEIKDDMDHYDIAECFAKGGNYLRNLLVHDIGKHLGLYFAGHSAGAHLVAKLISNAVFLESFHGAKRLRGAILISGVYDIQELINTSVNNLLDLSQEQAFRLSPQFDTFTHISLRKLRVFIIAGENDSPTFKKQSRQFYGHLEKEGLEGKVSIETKDTLDHFDIVECFAKMKNYLVNLILNDMNDLTTS